MPGTATRLAIEWKHAWPVRFAHHPLCERHRQETWRIGRLNLCRGCASLGLGLAVGIAAVLGFGGPWAITAAWVLLPLVLIGSWPTLYRRWPRAIRDLLRVGLGLLVVVGTYGVASAPAVAWPALPIAAVLWWVYRRQRVQVNARRCDGCPELGRGVCSGYAAHALAMRAIAADIEDRMHAAAASHGMPPFGADREPSRLGIITTQIDNSGYPCEAAKPAQGEHQVAAK